MRVAGYDYQELLRTVAERDRGECFVHRVLVARRAAVIERWRVGDESGDVDALAGWIPTGLLECDGPMDAHHLLSKSWLKREYPHGKGKLLGYERVDAAVLGRPDAVVISETVLTRSLADLLNDPRNGIIACRRHHDLIEGPTEAVKLWRSDLPPCAEEFAAELGTKAVARLERNFGLRPSVGERTGG